MSRPDRWLVLMLRVASDDPLRDLWSEALVDLGGSSVLDQGDTLTTFIPPPEMPEGFLEHARARLGEGLLAGAPLPEMAWRWEDDQDWSREWRAGLRPRKLTDRLVVKPTWASWSGSPGEIVIEIDPQMAFGTGEHATTRGCLRLLDGIVPPGGSVLDIGSGSAILSIAAARMGAGRVVAIESDPDANLNARENLEANGVTDRVEIVEATADAGLVERFGAFDVILANILSGVIKPLLPAMTGALRSGGRLILSGILQSESDDVVAAAAATGLRLVAEDREDEWWSGLMEATAG